MIWPIKEYSINSIYLDSKNIRLPMNETAQDALIHDLFSNEDALEIVKSIVQYGIFPDEFPIVVKENNKLIVIEGNRRLAALKALDEPDRIPFFKDRLKTLPNPKIQKIYVVIAPSRNAATQLIANKHTINLRRPWKPLRQAYFYKSQIVNGKTIDELKIEYPGHDIQKFIRMLEAHHLAKSIPYDNEQVRSLVHDERKFPITNLERMYDDTYVTEYLGISFDSNGKLTGSTKTEEFKKVFQKIVEDIALENLNSRNTNNKDQRQAYINNLPLDLKPTLADDNFTSDSFAEEKVDKSTINKAKRSTKKPKGLIPSFIPFKLESSSLRIIYDELRDLSVDEFPNAAHDLLRSFLECSLVYYLKETDEYKLVAKNDNHNQSWMKCSRLLSLTNVPQ